MAAPYRTTREITTQECQWLDKTIEAGRLVYRYDGCTYGCISGEGIAVTEKPDETPFFEVPRDALVKI